MAAVAAEEQLNDDRSAEFISAIAQVVPLLEKLDLRTRWYGEEIRFLESSESISTNALKEGMATLSNLESMALPTSISTARDHKILMSSSSYYASFSTALSNSATAERSLAAELGADNVHLTSISFVRPVSPMIDSHSPPTQSSITYTIDSTPEHVISTGYNTPTIIRPGTTEVQETIHIESAEYDQVDAHPRSIRGCSFRRVLSRFKNEQQVTMTIIIAGATAFAVSEAGKLLGA